MDKNEYVDGSDVDYRPPINESIVAVLSAMSSGADEFTAIEQIVVLPRIWLVGILARLETAGLVNHRVTVHGDSIWLMTARGREIAELLGLGD
jgi:hypothetical protein